jgi:hypothetical protein
VQSCTDEFGGAFTAPFIDCSVIETGAVFDLCFDVQVEDGVFEFLSAGEFLECTNSSFSAANDVCSEAELIQADGSTIFGTTGYSFTVEAPSCAAGGDDSPGLWYTVMGNGNGIKATTCVDVTSWSVKLATTTPLLVGVDF